MVRPDRSSPRLRLGVFYKAVHPEVILHGSPIIVILYFFSREIKEFT